MKIPDRTFPGRSLARVRQRYELWRDNPGKDGRPRNPANPVRKFILRGSGDDNSDLQRFQNRWDLLQLDPQK